MVTLYIGCLDLNLFNSRTKQNQIGEELRNGGHIKDVRTLFGKKKYQSF